MNVHLIYLLSVSFFTYFFELKMKMLKHPVFIGVSAFFRKSAKISICPFRYLPPNCMVQMG